MKKILQKISKLQKQNTLITNELNVLTQEIRKKVLAEIFNTDILKDTNWIFTYPWVIELDSDYNVVIYSLA